MTRDDIIRIAQEAGWSGIYSKPLMSIAMQEDDFLRFAALVAAAEREVCARMVDHIWKEGGGTYGIAIRARGEQEQPR